MRKITRGIVALAGSAVLLTTGCSQLPNVDNLQTLAPTESGTATTERDAGSQTTPEQDAQANYHYTEGVAKFSDNCPDSGTNYTGTVSENGRIGSVCSVITANAVQSARERGRLDINVDPAGWGHNDKATINMGDRDYNGYFYNRSHLLADSLGGNPIYGNLITGTRTQNVGDNQGGGMGYAETQVRDWFADGKNASCPVTYEATPTYGENAAEVIPRSVRVDVQSCDKTINERVVVPNTAVGFTVNYVNGTYQKN